ncbi:MAG: ParB/RepB/Spo0J family partition protein [Candidatus Kerfeldbacteria bacterium]|nr:ParB/RepB/Spo0J family partition protein [Candidatus Kerfeldbacteria bacterium]
MTSTTLGRGLSSLIPPMPGQSGSAGGEQVLQIPIDQIKPNPQQPRHQFDHDALDDLIQSIKTHGIIQPLVVIRVGSGYQLIAGERRLRAAKMLDKQKVPAVVRSASEQQQLELALVENVQRQNLNPIDKAIGYQRLIDEFSMTQEAVAKQVGQSRAAVANAVRLLALPQPMRDALADGRLTEGHAKVLLSVKTDTERERIFQDILQNKLTVRGAETHVRTTTVHGHTRRAQTDPNLKASEEALEEKLGTKVQLKRTGSSGTITIHFYSREELDQIIRTITS